MSPSLIPNITDHPRQGVLWGENFDPWAVPDEALSGRPDTVFLALQPPPEIADRAYQLGRGFHNKRGLHCSLIGPKRLHLTLLGVGMYEALSRTIIEAICRIAASIAMQPFLVGLNRMMSLDNKRDWPFVLVGDDRTIPGIVMLCQQVIAALRRAGCRRFTRSSFTPHMTLFRSRCNLGERDIDEIKWFARDFVLIHSLHGLGEHEVLGRWPLQASA
jgi:RNA 2',3'-cyclic 3'-phosphodiesterase